MKHELTGHEVRMVLDSLRDCMNALAMEQAGCTVNRRASIRRAEKILSWADPHCPICGCEVSKPGPCPALDCRERHAQRKRAEDKAMREELAFDQWKERHYEARMAGEDA